MTVKIVQECHVWMVQELNNYGMGSWGRPKVKHRQEYQHCQLQLYEYETLKTISLLFFTRASDPDVSSSSGKVSVLTLLTLCSNSDCGVGSLAPTQRHTGTGSLSLSLSLWRTPFQLPVKVPARWHHASLSATRSSLSTTASIPSSNIRYFIP